MPFFAPGGRYVVLLVALVALWSVSAACAGDTPTAPAEEEPAPAMTGMAMQTSMKKVGSVTWEGMRISVAVSKPTTHTVFQGTDSVLVTPTPQDSVHMMVLLADQETSERIPYSTVWLTVLDPRGAVVFDERMWPMLSRSMGVHYGINVPLPRPDLYTLQVQVGPPVAARHPEYAEVWTRPYVFEMEYRWEGGDE